MTKELTVPVLFSQYPLPANEPDARLFEMLAMVIVPASRTQRNCHVLPDVFVPRRKDTLAQVLALQFTSIVELPAVVRGISMRTSSNVLCVCGRIDTTATTPSASLRSPAAQAVVNTADELVGMAPVTL